MYNCLKMKSFLNACYIKDVHNHKLYSILINLEVLAHRLDKKRKREPWALERNKQNFHYLFVFWLSTQKPVSINQLSSCTEDQVVYKWIIFLYNLDYKM